MFIFLFILVAGLTLIYVNVSPVAAGKKGKLIALAILLAIFTGMFFRSTLIGCAVVAFTSVWLCQALLFFIPWDLFQVVRRIVCRRAMNQRTLMLASRILLSATIALTLSLFAYGVPHNSSYRLLNAVVKLPSRNAETEGAGDVLPNNRSKSFTVVFFSDIHVDPLFRRAKLERIIADVDSIAPDYLLFGGDLADVSMEQLDKWGYDSLFRKLTAVPKVAAVAVNGNHEGMQEGSGVTPGEWMRKVGFIVLDDSSACIGPACFTGRTDFQVAYRRGIERMPLEALAPRDSVLPWLLLDHQPKGIEPNYSGRLPNFAFSGHTHDGQFFPGTVIINFVWRLAYGEGVLDGVRWLVSAGVDCWGPPVRVGSDADMWVVRFDLE